MRLSPEKEEEGEGGQDAGTDEPIVDRSPRASQVEKAKADKDIISPHTINGFWVQQQISEVYPDPVTAADRAAITLSILGLE
ncbi:hypothetical protein JVU11DRAFT_7031 [Chiua virens]|nr:hypothetical protein JVU11DRAFT_7031 [Chiua virens]